MGLKRSLTYKLVLSKLASMNLDELQVRAGAAERLLKAMASQPRLMILCELLKGERTVTALQQSVGLSMSAISQHLARLRADDLVSTRRESQTIHYSIASEPAKAVIETLYGLFCLPALDQDQGRATTENVS
jgi:DNA-binding transcriptional ArsR family regulator